jgi:hypothetical protein
LFLIVADVKKGLKRSFWNHKDLAYPAAAILHILLILVKSTINRISRIASGRISKIFVAIFSQR